MQVFQEMTALQGVPKYCSFLQSHQSADKLNSPGSCCWCDCEPTTWRPFSLPLHRSPFPFRAPSAGKANLMAMESCVEVPQSPSSNVTHLRPLVIESYLYYRFWLWIEWIRDLFWLKECRTIGGIAFVIWRSLSDIQVTRLFLCPLFAHSIAQPTGSYLCNPAISTIIWAANG